MLIDRGITLKHVPLTPDTGMLYCSLWVKVYQDCEINAIAVPPINAGSDIRLANYGGGKTLENNKCGPWGRQ